MRVALGLGVVALGLSAFIGGVSTPAEAGGKVYCEYRASDVRGNMVQGGANHKKGSVACKRARRECNRKLERKQRQKKFGRTSGCGKVTFG